MERRGGNSIFRVRVGEEQEEGCATKISHMLHMCGNTSVELAGVCP
jgi:hypothetical protein